MIGKFISKALQSMAADKDAKKNLKPKKKKKTAPKPQEPLKTVAVEKAAPKAPVSMPPRGAATEDVHQLIMDSLRAAEEELAAKPEMTSERQALIQQAMDIQRSKAHVLDDLSPEAREKLYVMALKTLGGNQ